MSVMAQPYRCDAPGCEQVRENDANHWWLLWLDRGADRDFQIQLSPWHPVMATEAFVKHYCGLEHALAAVASEAQKITDEITRKPANREVGGPGNADLPIGAGENENTDAA
jgi:hypothetical protein